MTPVTSPPQAIPAPLRARRSPVALIVADERSCDRAIEVLHEALDVASASVMIATLPMPLHLGVAAFAPLSGMTTHARLVEESLQRADRAARSAALRLSATYRTVRSWSQVADVIEHGRHDVVVLGCVPRRRTLRRLVAAATAAQTALLVASPSTACR